jgi:hypothetical protein
MIQVLATNLTNEQVNEFMIAGWLYNHTTLLAIMRTRIMAIWIAFGKSTSILKNNNICLMT